MTEAEWLKCNDPWQMCGFVSDQPGMIRRKAGRRKLRLLGVACCRMLGPLMADSRSLAAIEMAERLADGRASQKEVSVAEAKARQAYEHAFQSYLDSAKVAQEKLVEPYQAAQWAASLLNRQAGNFSVAGLCHKAWDRDAPDYEAYQERRLRQANVLRCLFGNPFRPISFDPAYLTRHDGLLVSMAQRMYDSRDFSDMPVLADAIEEAGCTNPDVLNHCRSGGEHVRGCWVIDSVLGKK